MEKRPQKLLDQVRGAIRLKHDSIRTEEAYVNWIRRYILFHNKRLVLPVTTGFFDFAKSILNPTGTD